MMGLGVILGQITNKYYLIEGESTLVRDVKRKNIIINNIKMHIIKAVNVLSLDTNILSIKLNNC